MYRQPIATSGDQAIEQFDRFYRGTAQLARLGQKKHGVRLLRQVLQNQPRLLLGLLPLAGLEQMDDAFKRRLQVSRSAHAVLTSLNDDSST